MVNAAGEIFFGLFSTRGCGRKNYSKSTRGCRRKIYLFTRGVDKKIFSLTMGGGHDDTLQYKKIYL